MRMERAQVGFETSTQSSFLDALVQLKQMRMSGAYPDPDDVWAAFTRKRAEPGEGKEECLPLNRAEILLQVFRDIFPHVAEKAEG